MQPIIDYSSITIGEANTVITYYQWEDGYEAAADFPHPKHDRGVGPDGDNW